MKPVCFITLLASMLIAAAAKPAASASAPTDLHSAARAVHTDACATRTETAVHHARHRHHHRMARARATLTATTTTRPQPLHPARQRPEHRAALPQVSRSVRDHSGPRTGGRALATQPGLASLLTVSVTPLDP